MKRLEKDIERANEFEIVLSDAGSVIWLPRFVSLFAFAGGCMALFTGDFISPLFLLGLGVICWQMMGRVTIIQFNRPTGYLTVLESPWWSILIPAGPNLIKVPTRVPLPKTSPFVEHRSGTMTYPVQTGPDSVEIRQQYIESFIVQLPLDDGKVFTLWATRDQNTYIEIIRRVNKAIQDYNQMSH